MSNPKGRTLPDAFSVSLIMLIIHCIDIFFFESDLSVLGDNFYGRFLCFVALFFVLWVTKTPVNTLGISKKPKKFATGIVYGFIFSVIPIAVVMIIEAVIYKTTGLYELRLFLSIPGRKYIRTAEYLTPQLADTVYILAAFFGACFKEMFFRGYLLKKIKSVTDFLTANIVQSIIYTVFIVPKLIRNFGKGYYDEKVVKIAVFVVLFYLIHEFITAFKWGLLTRVTGCVYVSIIDNFFYVFLANSVYITARYETWSFFLHMLATQIASFVLVIIYYKKCMKKIALKQQKKKEESEMQKKAKAAQKQRHIETNYKDKKLKGIDEISPNEYKTAVEKTSHRHRSSIQNSSKRNERHSIQNEGFFEEASTSDAGKLASEFLEQRMKKTHKRHHSSNLNQRAEEQNANKIESFNGDIDSYEKEETQHHHHHHSSEHKNRYAEKVNGERIESFNGVVNAYKMEEKEHQHHRQNNEKVDKANADKLMNYDAESILQKTEEYSQSLQLERKMPKRPHPHDKIAVDGQLSYEEIDRANSEIIGDFSDTEIDNFLKSFSEDMSKSSHRSRNNNGKHAEYNKDKLDELSENFDTDKFLQQYQDNYRRKHHHHHHHSSSYDKRESETQAQTEEKAEKAKIVEQQMSKSNWFDRLKNFSSIDDSRSNDLL